MLTTVWIVRAEQFEVDDFVARHSIASTNTWRVGQADELGKVRHDSGFNACISECEDWPFHLNDIRCFLDQYVKAIAEIKDRSLSSMLHTGFSINERSAVMGTVSFPPELLRRLVEGNLELCVSSYLASDPGCPK